jgi:hypothetical protein
LLEIKDLKFHARIEDSSQNFVSLLLRSKRGRKTMFFDAKESLLKKNFFFAKLLLFFFTPLQHKVE